jgi:hypothetical protein
MSRRSALAFASFVVAGVRREAAFIFAPGKKWSRFKAPGLPHLAGAHLYIEQRGSAYLCSLCVNNGTLEDDKSWQGIFSFSDFQLTITGLTNKVVVMDRELDGGVYTFAPRTKFSIRFAVAATEEQARAVLHYGDRGPWEPLAGDYGPTNMNLPNVDQHLAYYEQEQEAKCVSDLAVPVSLFHHKGLQDAPLDGMAPGGDGILPDGHGYKKCRPYILHSRRAFDDWMDRVGPVFLYDSKGRQLSVNSFQNFVPHAEVQVGPKQTNRDLPMFLTMEKGWGQQEYRRLTHDDGKTYWEWQAMAISHIIRVLHHGIACWEYTHDPMIADHLLAVFRAFQFLDFSHHAQAPLDDPWHFSLKKYLADAHANPHNGAQIDRAAAWMGYLGAQLVRMEQLSIIPWLEMWCELMEVSATPDGINNVLPYHSYMPTNTLGTQLFHDALIKYAYLASCLTLGRDGSVLLRLWCYSVLNNRRLPFLVYPWNAQQFGPPWFIATHVDGIAVRISGENATGCGKPGYSTGYSGTVEHLWPVLAGTYRMTAEAFILKFGLKVWIIHPTNEARLAYCETQAEKNWIAEMQSVLEN